MESLIEKLKALPERPTVVQTADALGVSPSFIRLGLQHQRLPIGVAIKPEGSSRWTYAIFRDRVIKFKEGTL